jgi:hypothetical protein
MSEYKNSDYSNIYKNNQESSNFTNYQKKILLSNINLAKKNFNLKKTQSPNKISNLKLTKFKINSDNRSDSQYILSNDTNLKFNNIKLIRNSRSQNLLNSVKSTKKNYLNSVDYSKDKNTERIFLLKIDEVNKTLEESENIFRYNQKILKKKLEEKNNQINTLRNELFEEKKRKKNLYESVFNENKNNFLDEIKQLQKQVEKLTNMNLELSRQNLEYENIIQNLEDKNRENISKIKEIYKKYNSLIKDKTNDILENEIKQYINDLNIQIESSLNELNSLNEEMSSIKDENKKLKMLSREIIEARSDTELFFIDVLNDAKKDLYKQKKEKIRGFSFFPKLKNFYDKGDEIKVDIRELTPEMREKMLRNLFEKINRSHNENNFLELNYMINGDIDNIEN